MNSEFRERMAKDALIKGQYRYYLTRDWSSPWFSPWYAKLLMIVMLNPSTADDKKDDPTIRRCINLADCYGFNKLVVVNLYAFRATKPADLFKAADPVGPHNKMWIREFAAKSDGIICAWGAKAPEERANQVIEYLKGEGKDKRRLYCFGLNKNFSPKHPLYLPSTPTLESFRPEIVTEAYA